MRTRNTPRRDQAHLVTEARQSRSAEINQRERRYLVMMGIRVLCFVVSILMFVNHLGLLALIPAAGAILLPYFAVVVANARQVSGSGGFRPYQPRLPERYDPTAAGQAGPAGGGQPDGGQPDGGQPDGGQRGPGQSAGPAAGGASGAGGSGAGTDTPV
ncbi:MAG: DUF3099 domain-containing protein [Streptosporangiaceae bacterium]